jgi:hypothetical protein
MGGPLARRQGNPNAARLPVMSTGLASPGAAGSGGPVPRPATAGHSREPIRPAEGTIDGWLMNRLFPGR